MSISALRSREADQFSKLNFHQRVLFRVSRQIDDDASNTNFKPFGREVKNSQHNKLDSVNNKFPEHFLFDIWVWTSGFLLINFHHHRLSSQTYTHCLSLLLFVNWKFKCKQFPELGYFYSWVMHSRHSHLRRKHASVWLNVALESSRSWLCAWDRV